MFLSYLDTVDHESLSMDAHGVTITINLGWNDYYDTARSHWTLFFCCGG